ncbi:methionyl-tRNA formyltransferase [Flavobacterium magnum]|uniref:Methionyl-tRNA formyltransferase n=1 Tax=Flavobacterium magnum TaxID=2162713 RepID=A0A2S0RI48_9FLAO|nr:methionyl-tRNA formyltransferase [Flavobacterium magnum]AWA31305.1 methionyl-tRNA formyltransferase [Flavobacterium magnum]
MRKLKIIFMGTPEFAVGILDNIIGNQYEVAAVVTAPDKPAGRGQKIKYSAVKDYALQKDLPVLQPTNLKDEAFLAALKSFGANLHVVVAFRMLPKAVWDMPEYGTFNLHASLLPQYRGAAPINWAIINGETRTGVTTFFIDDKIDTGAIILSSETSISETENAGELHDRLMDIGQATVVRTLELIASGDVRTHVQTDSDDLKTAYKLHRDNCKIDWEKPGKEIHNLIRGLSPYPAAWCFFDDGATPQQIKIYDAAFEQAAHQQTPGSLKTDRKTISVAVKDGFVHILSLQLPGKKKMTAAELLNGMAFAQESKFC